MDTLFSGKRQPRTYQGPNLLQIALPIGGIGAGCICLNGYGGLQDFSIHNAPALSAMPDRHQPQDAGFALLHLPAQGQTRLVEGPFPPEKIYNLGLKSQGYNGGSFLPPSCPPEEVPHAGIQPSRVPQDLHRKRRFTSAGGQRRSPDPTRQFLAH